MCIEEMGRDPNGLAPVIEGGVPFGDKTQTVGGVS
jgi:hypothetical protein